MSQLLNAHQLVDISSILQKSINGDDDSMNKIYLFIFELKHIKAIESFFKERKESFSIACRWFLEFREHSESYIRIKFYEDLDALNQMNDEACHARCKYNIFNSSLYSIIRDYRLHLHRCNDNVENHIANLQNDYKNGCELAIYYLGYLHEMIGKYNQAIDYYTQSSKLHVVKALVKLGNIFSRDVNSNYYNLDKSEKCFIEIYNRGYKKYAIQSLYRIYCIQNNIPKLLKVLQIAMKKNIVIGSDDKIIKHLFESYLKNI
jgi:hypothetical protein